MDRDTFFKPQELQIYEVEIEGLGKVRAKELTNGERIKQYDLWLAPSGEIAAGRRQFSREKMITLCLVDAKGDPLLSESDIGKVRAMPARIVSQLTELAMKCLGLGEEDLGEQLKKKSDNCEEASKGSCT